MNAKGKTAIYLALLHHPVYNKHREVVTTAVTNVDVHDVARSAKTYGLSGVFFVTPIEQQQALVSEIIGHWTDGAGARYNPIRAQAFVGIRVATALADAVREIERIEGCPPQLVATSARESEDMTSYETYRAGLEKGVSAPQLLLFGTGWGMVEELLEQVSVRLEPVRIGATGTEGPYNHLSVRSAVAIVLDRLRGDRQAAEGKVRHSR